MIEDAVVDIYGDPKDWPSIGETAGVGEVVSMRLCPQCGAAVVHPHQHKAWHIRFDWEIK